MNLSARDENRSLERESRHVLKIHNISLGSRVGNSKDLITSDFAI